MRPGPELRPGTAQGPGSAGPDALASPCWSCGQPADEAHSAIAGGWTKSSVGRGFAATPVGAGHDARGAHDVCGGLLRRGARHFRQDGGADVGGLAPRGSRSSTPPGTRPTWACPRRASRATRRCCRPSTCPPCSGTAPRPSPPEVTYFMARFDALQRATEFLTGFAGLGAQGHTGHRGPYSPHQATPFPPRRKRTERHGAYVQPHLMELLPAHQNTRPIRPVSKSPAVRCAGRRNLYRSTRWQPRSELYDQSPPPDMDRNSINRRRKLAQREAVDTSGPR